MTVTPCACTECDDAVSARRHAQNFITYNNDCHETARMMIAPRHMHAESRTCGTAYGGVTGAW